MTTQRFTTRAMSYDSPAARCRSGAVRHGAEGTIPEGIPLEYALGRQGVRSLGSTH